MTRKTPPQTAARKPKQIMGLRERSRADGSVRLWWEPRTAARRFGFTPIELDADRMAWSRGRAEKLNSEVEQALATGKRAVGQSSTAQRGNRSIDDLIKDYTASPHFNATLKPKTGDSYRKLLAQIAVKWGPHRAGAFDKATMKAWYQTMYATKGLRMAQAMVRMMSVLFAHAEDLGWRPENSNPCFKLKVVTPAARHRAATEAELTAILNGAQALGLNAMVLAIELALYQGQRQTDIRTAPRGAFQLEKIGAMAGQDQRPVWVWRLMRSKRGNMGVLAVHGAVVPRLRAALADAGSAAKPNLPTDPLIKDEATGKPYSEFLFNRRWHAILDWAADPEMGNQPGVKDLQFRDLRRTFAIFARAGGATDDDLGDVLGNSAATNAQLAETYMPPSFATTSRAIHAVRLPPIAKTSKKGSNV